MFNRLTIFFPLILAAILALLTFWVNKTVELSARKGFLTDKASHDYMLKHFSTTKTDLMGNIEYVLSAEEMAHFPNDDSTVLQQPKFTQFTINKPYTQIQGLRGYVSSNGETVEIVDEVKVIRQAFEGKGEMQLHTEKLEIFPKQDLVKTNSPVTITQAPKTVVHAIGMIYDKKKQTFTLLKKVRAHYEKPKLQKLGIAKRANKIESLTQNPVPKKMVFKDNRK